jgi:DNA-binding winged helix-turn-helix (wHTH) protein
MHRHNRIVHFDWQHDCVLRDDIAVYLSGQEKILLRLLVDNGGRTCSRAELMVAIWGPRAPHVDEMYLTQLIYRLRRSVRPVCLGTHIVTIPRTGYRFEAEGLECRFGDCGTATGIPRSHARSDAVDAHAPRNALLLPTIDPLHHGVTHAGVTVYLTRLEHALLDALIGRPGVAIGHTELIARVWGGGVNVDANRLTRLVSRLRRSLRPLGLDQCVVYFPREGYRFRCERIPTVAQTGDRAQLRLRELRRYVMLGAAHAVVLLTAALSVCGTTLPTSAKDDAVSVVTDTGETPGPRSPQATTVGPFAFETTLRRIASLSEAIETAARRKGSNRPAR